MVRTDIKSREPIQEFKPGKVLTPSQFSTSN
jgi:hypothetical protein